MKTAKVERVVKHLIKRQKELYPVPIQNLEILKSIQLFNDQNLLKTQKTKSLKRSNYHLENLNRKRQ